MAVLINNTDIASVYGAIVESGGYDGIVGWPGVKTVDTNDWHEEEGIEADLSALKLSAHQFTMKFGLKYSSPVQIEAFYRFLGSSPKVTYADDTIGVVKTLRVESMSSLRCARRLSLLSVKFSCDENPLEGYTRAALVGGLCPENNELKIDDHPFSDYGFRILDGTYNSLLKFGPVKSSLLRNPSTVHGAEYDQNPLLWNGTEWVRSNSSDEVRIGPFQVSINLGIVAPNLNAFWTNYKALLYDLIKQNPAETDPLLKCQRELYVAKLNKIVKCYYGGQSVEEFRILGGGRVWMKFSLTLNVTKPSEWIDALLVSEADQLIETEDGYLILV